MGSRKKFPFSLFICKYRSKCFLTLLYRRDNHFDFSFYTELFEHWYNVEIVIVSQFWNIHCVCNTRKGQLIRKTCLFKYLFVYSLNSINKNCLIKLGAFTIFCILFPFMKFVNLTICVGLLIKWIEYHSRNNKSVFTSLFDVSNIHNVEYRLRIPDKIYRNWVISISIVLFCCYSFEREK